MHPAREKSNGDWCRQSLNLESCFTFAWRLKLNEIMRGLSLFEVTHHSTICFSFTFSVSSLYPLTTITISSKCVLSRYHHDCSCGYWYHHGFTKIVVRFYIYNYASFNHNYTNNDYRIVVIIHLKVNVNFLCKSNWCFIPHISSFCLIIYLPTIKDKFYTYHH